MTDNKTAWEERRRAERINALSAIRGLASDLLRYEQSNVKVHFAVDLPAAQENRSIDVRCGPGSDPPRDPAASGRASDVYEARSRSMTASTQAKENKK